MRIGRRQRQENGRICYIESQTGEMFTEVQANREKAPKCRKR